MYAFEYSRRTALHARLAGLIGNLLGHYDVALYALLAPIMAPLFFEETDPVTALIAAYAIIPLGVMTKPLGSLFFGWIGDVWGRKQALCCSLVGMACTTFLMGLLPTCSQVGFLASCLLATGRMLQSFFAAGESTGASIFILENTPTEKRSVISSFYDGSSMLGVLIASGLVTFFSALGWIEERWRFLFGFGGVTALFGLFLRFKTQEGTEFFSATRKWELLGTLRKHIRAFLAVVIASGFSYTTYSMAFTLMNGFVPLVAPLSRADVLTVNTELLVVDLVLLPCFGWLATRIGKERVMVLGAMGASLTALPLFSLLGGAGLWGMIVVRFVLVFFGVAFSAPYHAWKMELIPPEHRYTILSLGCTLGSQLIGAPASVIGLCLYKKMGVVWAPGLYLTLVGLLAGGAVWFSGRMWGEYAHDHKKNV